MILANPAAAEVDSSIIEELTNRCEDSIESVSTLLTSRPDEAVRIVADLLARAEEGTELLVLAVGGDGTVREAAEGLARGLGRWPGVEGGHAQAALFIVPAGSGNSAYHELWGGQAWRDCLDMMLKAQGCHVRDIDLVRIAEVDRGSLLGVNVGLIARIAQVIERNKAMSGTRIRRSQLTTEQKDDQSRYWAALSEVLGDLRPFPAHVVVDGETIFRGPTTLITIGGVRSFGRGSFQLLPHSVLDDGRLDVCTVAELTGQGIAELGVLAASGEHLEQPEVSYAQGAQVMVERLDGERLLVEHDGDPRMAGTTITLDVVPCAVPVVAP